jgi:hypothetical protein
MTLKEFREVTKYLPGKTEICYHSWDKGCSLSTYDLKELWLYKAKEKAIVLNPGVDYDDRKPKELT